MSSPTIPDLPSASVVNDSDQLLVRQPAGSLGTDKKATAALLRQFNVSGFPNLPSNPVINDLMSLARGGINYKLRFDQVSFIPGTQMWFYQNTQPSGWSIIGAGDTLLAVKGGTSYTMGGQDGQGTWQQRDVSGVEGQGLSVDQIPPHYHLVPVTGSTSTPASWSSSASQNNNDNVKINSGYTGGGGSTQGKSPTPLQPSDPHNHGNNWRPLASVGILCKKDNI